MKNKQIIGLLAFSLIGFGIGYVLTNSTIFNLCSHDQYACRALLNRIGDPLFYGMGALALVFFILLFSPRTFYVWKKFAIWFVPLAALLFIFYTDPGSGDLFLPYPEQVFQWVSGFYVLVSAVIIAIASLCKPEYPIS
jgi:hypothetical protein